MSSKTIKGQAWIDGDSLVQEQIVVFAGGKETYNTVVLVEDVWEDLCSASGTYKTNQKKDYFYWEYEMTDIEDDDVYITVKFECPKPKDGLFTEPYNPATVNGDYAKHWVAKLAAAQKNYEKAAAIQKKEVTFPGTSVINVNGNTVEYSDITVKGNDIGDITNLLSLF